MVDYSLYVLIKKRCVQKVENVWIYTSVHKAFITLFTFTRGKGLPFFMLDTFNVSAFNIISFFLAFFGLFLYLASIHYLQAKNDCVCVCAVVEYQITIAESNLWPPPISLLPPSLYNKTFRNTCIRTIWNVELCWIDTVGFYSLCFKKLGDICDENITAKVKNLETDRHIYIFAMHIVSPVVFMKS